MAAVAQVVQPEALPDPSEPNKRKEIYSYHAPWTVYTMGEDILSYRLASF